MKVLINLILLHLLALLAHAQQSGSPAGILKGRVTDDNHQPLPFASLSLLDSALQKQVMQQTTDSSGAFLFTLSKPGWYCVSASFGGKKTGRSEWISIDSLHHSVMLPALVLKDSSAALQEVSVTARRPLLQYQVDKTIVNVESMVGVAGTTSYDLLEKTPGVGITAGGEISLQGKQGVTIMIDGRTIYLAAAELTAYLKSLPAALVDKIELIENPSARYDAAGNAIINIRLKRNRAGGFTGNVTMGLSQGQYARNSNALNLNYRRGKTNVFGSFSLYQEQVYSLDEYYREYYNGNDTTTSSLQLNNWQKSKLLSGNVQLGMDFRPSEKTTWGWQAGWQPQQRKGWLESENTYFLTGDTPDAGGSGQVQSNETRNQYSLNANWQHTSANKAEWSADVNYVRYKANGSQLLENQNWYSGNTPVDSSDFTYNMPGTISILTVRADYSHSLGKRGKWETGLKSGWVSNDQQTITDFHQNSNHYRYNEQVQAVYGNLQQQWNRLALQAGLRLEYTSSAGEQKGNDQVSGSNFNQQYLNAFPSVTVSWKLDSAGRNSLSGVVTRRISRPNYLSLNPFLYYRDQYSRSGGNPLLTPQFQQRFELRFVHHQWLRLSASYNRYKDVIFQLTSNENEIFITRPENIAEGFMLLFAVNVQKQINHWWSVNCDVYLNRLGVNGQADGLPLQPQATILRVSLNNQFNFKKGWAGNMGGYFANKDLNGQSFTGPRYRLQAAVQKKILRERGTLGLAVEDIAHSWKQRNRSMSMKQSAFTQYNETDTQRIGLSFSWRFGKEEQTRKRKYQSSAADEEKSRAD
ncbi:outer membrane beta-barrel protein [Flavihumibacter petaseus]|uniref:Putative TonB-dependent receptor n=1 Tax=Flavihumibacter petaseus NBRC 106054 TaxID=1220578 RepID=A0A0E9N4Q3_9BACT|nr:outer membrane beta-barrel protein [Flavihumibacter petaseus]GAO44927.1 putative TonB-dependent receptor [Flavihumibacter petaseus NBRC 106054]